jgi:hypothetical protein
VGKVTDSLFVHVDTTGGDLTMTSTDVRSNAGIDAQPDNLVVLPQDRASGFLRAVPELAGLRCDAVAAPMDVCCGVLDQLTQTGEPVPPVLQLGHRMLFLVRTGSSAAVLRIASLAADRATLGIQVADDLRHLAGGPGGNDTCWLVPPSNDGRTELPSASTVVNAIRVAYAAFGPREGA